jgi:hypothetical protein
MRPSIPIGTTLALVGILGLAVAIIGCAPARPAAVAPSASANPTPEEIRREEFRKLLTEQDTKAARKPAADPAPRAATTQDPAATQRPARRGLIPNPSEIPELRNDDPAWQYPTDTNLDRPNRNRGGVI